MTEWDVDESTAFEESGVKYPNGRIVWGELPSPAPGYPYLDEKSRETAQRHYERELNRCGITPTPDLRLQFLTRNTATAYTDPKEINA